MTSILSRALASLVRDRLKTGSGYEVVELPAQVPYAAVISELREADFPELEVIVVGNRSLIFEELDSAQISYHPDENGELATDVRNKTSNRPPTLVIAAPAEVERGAGLVDMEQVKVPDLFKALSDEIAQTLESRGLEKSDKAHTIRMEVADGLFAMFTKEGASVASLNSYLESWSHDLTEAADDFQQELWRLELIPDSGLSGSPNKEDRLNKNQDLIASRKPSEPSGPSSCI